MNKVLKFLLFTPSRAFTFFFSKSFCSDFCSYTTECVDRKDTPYILQASSLLSSKPRFFFSGMDRTKSRDFLSKANSTRRSTKLKMPISRYVFISLG